jgi:hypothetical protein
MSQQRSVFLNATSLPVETGKESEILSAAQTLQLYISDLIFPLDQNHMYVDMRGIAQDHFTNLWHSTT